MKWLLQTVGGSSEPIIKAINTLRSDRVIFICSGNLNGAKGSCSQVLGQGMVCGKPGEPATLPNIPMQAGILEASYDLSVYDADPDDLSQCYEKIADAIASIRIQDKDAQVYCDYTGGTKSMSGALAMAAVDDGDIRIMLVTGARRDLVKVEDGTEFLTPAGTESILLRRLTRELDRLLSQYDYAAAERIISTYLTESPRNALAQKWLLACRAFDAWDRFDHAQAFRLISGANSLEYTGHLRFLGPLARSTDPCWKGITGYQLVLDVLANAGRRASQGRYDDAVARHYRAVELLIQTYLWNSFGVDSGQVESVAIPDDIQWKEKIEEWPTALGLIKSWDLAAQLSDPIGSIWAEAKSRLLQAGKRRNYSILAHGTVPIDARAYAEDRENGMAGFVLEALRVIGEIDGNVRRLPLPPEFPTTTSPLI